MDLRMNRVPVVDKLLQQGYGQAASCNATSVPIHLADFHHKRPSPPQLGKVSTPMINLSPARRGRQELFTVLLYHAVLPSLRWQACGVWPCHPRLRPKHLPSQTINETVPHSHVNQRFIKHRITNITRKPLGRKSSTKRCCCSVEQSLLQCDLSTVFIIALRSKSIGRSPVRRTVHQQLPLRFRLAKVLLTTSPCALHSEQVWTSCPRWSPWEASQADPRS
eukprot:332268-Amphidinium_carterae.1